MHSYMLIILTNFNPISTHTSRLFTATAAHVNTCLELVYSCCKPQEALASNRDFSQKLPFKVFLPIEYYHRVVCTPGTAKLFQKLKTYVHWKLCNKFAVIVQTLLLTCLITSSVNKFVLPNSSTTNV